MSFIFRIIFVSILASFGGFIAYDYFATPALHGILSGDVLLFFVIWLLPRKSKFKIVLILCSILTAIYFNPVIGIILLYTTCISIVPRNSIKKSILLTFPIILFSIVSECIAFFKESFIMDISQIWEVSSFFWWGGILFFLIPLGYTALILYFSKIFFEKSNAIAAKPIATIACIPLILFANMAFAGFQNRMLLVDFPIYREFWEFNKFSSFDKDAVADTIKAENLSESTKAVFKIWPPEDSALIKKKAVFILVESYGVHKDTSIAKQMIFSPFKHTNVTFAGLLPRRSMHTQGAELEDLGDIDSHDSTTIPLMDSLKKEKIESWYVHGYTGRFYSRDRMYNQFGFDSLLFADNIRERSGKMCYYGFEGICDSSMINLIDSILYRPGDKFVFWTTLDSHPPYNGNLILPSGSIFCKNPTISDKVCVYLSLVDNTLRKIAYLAQKHPDYQFVIRGDHRPMATIDPNDYYYAWVPVIILN